MVIKSLSFAWILHGGWSLGCVHDFAFVVLLMGLKP